MKRSTFATIAAAGLAAITIGLSTPAAAGPAGPGSAQDTISSLQASGYKVILNKLSDVPLDQATVVAIRPGRPVTQRVTDSGGDSIDKVLYTTVYVDVK
ncbi:hypothetical protein [Mycobacterium sp.]|uniref:hypothetical protein n=1 Tax=Mycobacterium sp. TaxID=1785 RepID=UPI003C795975